MFNNILKFQQSVVILFLFLKLTKTTKKELQQNETGKGIRNTNEEEKQMQQKKNVWKLKPIKKNNTILRKTPESNT